MKKILLGLSVIALMTQACRQQNAVSTDSGSANAQYQKLYEKSMKLKDLHTAITAIQMILVTDSANSLADSLPQLYAMVNNVEACYETVDASLKRHPQDEKLKEIKVLCLQSMGKMDEQFALLRELYESSHKPEYIMQIASIQANTGNIKDARQTLDTIISRYSSGKDMVDVPVDEMRKQSVPVNAYAWYMKGAIYMQQKSTDKAKECFFKSMEIYPDFVLPKRSLEMIFARR